MNSHKNARLGSPVEPASWSGCCGIVARDDRRFVQNAVCRSGTPSCRHRWRPHRPSLPPSVRAVGLASRRMPHTLNHTSQTSASAPGGHATYSCHQKQGEAARRASLDERFNKIDPHDPACNASHREVPASVRRDCRTGKLRGLSRRLHVGRPDGDLVVFGRVSVSWSEWPSRRHRDGRTLWTYGARIRPLRGKHPARRGHAAARAPGTIGYRLLSRMRRRDGSALR